MACYYWERPNAMYKLVYNTAIAVPFDENDSLETCELATREWANKLFNEPNCNPLKQKYRDVESFMNWFDAAYASNRWNG